MERPPRVNQLDLLRGVAVVVMIVGHTVDALLAESLRDGRLFWSYQLFRSMTAPLFLFTSGFVLMVATEKHWDSFLGFGPRLRARLRRVLLLMTLGYALHLPFFSLRKTLSQATEQCWVNFWQVDILQCIGVSLLLLHLTMWLARRPGRHALVVWAVAGGVVLLSPLVWSFDLAAWLPRSLVPYFNEQQLTIFPLFPYLGYVFFGAAIGHTFLAARRADAIAAWAGRLLIIGVLAIGGGLLVIWAPWHLYPPHDSWKINPASIALRLGLILLALRALFAWQRPPVMLGAAATLLGQSSLFVYVLHLIILYGSPVNRGLRSLLEPSLPFGAVVFTAAVMVLLMLGAAAGLQRLERWRPPVWRRVQYGLAGVAITLFAVLPH